MQYGVLCSCCRSSNQQLGYIFVVTNVMIQMPSGAENNARSPSHVNAYCIGLSGRLKDGYGFTKAIPLNVFVTFWAVCVHFPLLIFWGMRRSWKLFPSKMISHLLFK